MPDINLQLHVLTDENNLLVMSVSRLSISGEFVDKNQKIPKLDRIADKSGAIFQTSDFFHSVNSAAFSAIAL